MNWEPFRIASQDSRPQEMRGIETPHGIGDRLRTAAFAELQAREAFLWAARTFTDAPPGLVETWKTLAREEDKHLHWLLCRMEEIGAEVSERSVSDLLWHSLVSRKSARDFALFMASAENRGRQAGERFYRALQEIDPISANIFGKIAAEEIEHIRLAERFFGGFAPKERETSPEKPLI